MTTTGTTELLTGWGKMGKLKLLDVTLVCVETREHELANAALRDCLSNVAFGEVLVLTDRPQAFSGPFRHHKVVDWPDKIGWSRSWWHDVPPLLRTRHTLNIQWDSWVWDVAKWSDEFLEYDYIGAPWWYKDGKNVGNGGFSLVSTALKRYLWQNRERFPCDTNVDDDLLCRKYRSALEEVGFRWAPEEVARQFSWEGCNQPRTDQTHFGFHAMFNWPLVLKREDLMKRMRMVLNSKYLTSPSSYQLRVFAEMHPEIAKELLAEEDQLITKEL